MSVAGALYMFVLQAVDMLIIIVQPDRTSEGFEYQALMLFHIHNVDVISLLTN